MPKNILVAVAWPYVNGDLHVGHLAGYLLPADIFARFNRLIGNNVLMVSGSDCYGTPITVEADKRGISPEQLVTEYHPRDVRLFEQYNFSYDLYTKTTTENHARVTQDMFVSLANNGYIYTDKTDQYFSPKENKFLPDRYVEGTCPNCGFLEARADQCDKCGKVLESGELKKPVSKLAKTSVEMRATENYFLNWPKLQPFLEKYIQGHSKTWRPWIYEEALGWLKKGLTPRAITRDLTWGVSIPLDRLPKELQIENAESKRIYVWFEAVIGYLSASIEWSKGTDEWKKWWYNSDAQHYYFMGKDNLIFHTLFWPGQLYGYDKVVHLPDFPAINNFLNLEGQKFSKSRGIIIDSEYIGKTYGVDAVRFYLTYIMPENSDANFTWEDFASFNNNILIGKFGNFINRVLTLAKNITQPKSFKPDAAVQKGVFDSLSKAYTHLTNCEFKLYSQEIINLAAFGNEYVAMNEPWKVDKTGEEYKKIILNCLYVVLALLFLMKPLVPSSADKLEKMLGIEVNLWEKGKEEKTLVDLVSKISISSTEILFSKFEPEMILVEKEKLIPLVNKP